MPNLPPQHRPYTTPQRKPRNRFTQRKHDERRGTSHERGYGATWQKARAADKADTPLCWVCWLFGQYATAHIRDHIVPHRGDKAKQHGPTQMLCDACNKIKTAHEHSRYMRGLSDKGLEELVNESALRNVVLDDMRRARYGG